MDLERIEHWTPPAGWRRLLAIDSHTGGEPFRLIVDGLDEVPGSTMAERRLFALENLDDLRRATMLEPRGHDDMYGGWLGPPVESDSDLSVLFTHNDGFSTMCGHGIIALCKIVVDLRIIDPVEPETTLRIDTPAGLVTAQTQVKEGRALSTAFINVPSFVSSLDTVVDVPSFGPVPYDLAFGGAFYAVTRASSARISLDSATELIAAGRAIKSAIGGRGCRHPDDPSLDFLYGVIFTDDSEVPAVSRNVCVFADGEIDRSPTGTGVSARLAIAHRRGQLAVGEGFTVESIVGSRFSGVVAGETSVGGLQAVLPRISGSASILGRNELWIDPEDTLGSGFRLS